MRLLHFGRSALLLASGCTSGCAYALLSGIVVLFTVRMLTEPLENEQTWYSHFPVVYWLKAEECGRCIWSGTAGCPSGCAAAKSATGICCHDRKHTSFLLTPKSYSKITRHPLRTRTTEGEKRNQRIVVAVHLAIWLWSHLAKLDVQSHIVGDAHSSLLQFNVDVFENALL